MWLLSGVNMHCISHTQSVTLLYSPRLAQCTYWVSTETDDPSVRIKTKRLIWLFSLVTLVQAFQARPVPFVQNQKRRRVGNLQVLSPQQAISTKIQTELNNYTVFNEITFFTCNDNLLAFLSLQQMVAHHWLILTVFCSFTTLALGCSFLSKLTVSFFNHKKTECAGWIVFCLGDRLHIYPPPCVLPKQHGTDRMKSADWTEINDSLSPNWSWAAHLRGHLIINISA